MSPCGLRSGLHETTDLLSYRHSFHAGNYADVLKHLVLTEILRYLARKDAGFHFIDTHAGAGIYRLNSDHSQKLQEFRDGIGRLTTLDWPELAPYLALVARFNKSGDLARYPGSPMLAQTLLRPQDTGIFYELHPTDYPLLVRNLAKHKRVRAEHADGLQALPGLLPPVSRRGMVLIDPSYELKEDYRRVVSVLQQAHRRFATGVYALWYPVVDRQHIERLERDFRATGIGRIQRFELSVRAEGMGQGMTGSGMIVINAPWGLYELMAGLLPRLAHHLGHNGAGHYRCDMLAGE